MSTNPPFPNPGGDPPAASWQVEPPQGTPQWQQGQQQPYPQQFPAGPQFGGPPPYGYGYQEKSSNGMGIASMVLGIVSIPLFFLTFIDFPIAVLAIIFGIIVLARKRPGVKKGFAVTGLVTGIVGLVAAVVILIFIADRTRDCQDRLGPGATNDQIQQCVRDL